jgi:hypothetical protein
MRMLHSEEARGYSDICAQSIVRNCRSPAKAAGDACMPMRQYVPRKTTEHQIEPPARLVPRGCYVAVLSMLAGPGIHGNFLIVDKQPQRVLDKMCRIPDVLLDVVRGSEGAVQGETPSPNASPDLENAGILRSSAQGGNKLLTKGLVERVLNPHSSRAANPNNATQSKGSTLAGRPATTRHDRLYV